jgi:hypothetical protein
MKTHKSDNRKSFIVSLPKIKHNIDQTSFIMDRMYDVGIDEYIGNEAARHTARRVQRAINSVILSRESRGNHHNKRLWQLWSVCDSIYESLCRRQLIQSSPTLAHPRSDFWKQSKEGVRDR